MKKVICTLGLILGLSYHLIAAAAACSGAIGVYEEIINQTNTPLVASTFMSNNISESDFPLLTNVQNGKLVDIAKGDVTIKANGSVIVNNACGNGKDNYDMGISVGPYHIFSQKGTWPDWSDGLGKNYRYYHLATKKWNNDSSPYSWSVYATGGSNNYTYKLDYDKGQGADCQASTASICMATDLKDCNNLLGKNLCNTWVKIYIHNLGNNVDKDGKALPLQRPLGKY